ncbi:hypothetical protein SETIT_7G114500v2 [Setaria italica]|uniref:NADP-dependent oxidoreductase domain-containing protein n=1 Tax=Setaria italica TaxID=4555 RepID=A0A368RUF5_SETIT|nr:hypothetical protein SETIT_7G114500v2 [Setaria italica]
MASNGTAAAVPEVALRSGNARLMPVNAVLAAIEVGYRHFDTAYMYGTEKPLGDAVAEAEMFVTSKLWCTQYHPALALPDLRQTLQYESPYLDLYLIHWPVCIKPVPPSFPAKKEDAMPFDFERACGSSGR